MLFFRSNPRWVAFAILSLGAALIGRAGPGEIVSSQQIQEGYIAVTGGRVWYRMVGVGKPGIPLLALHGGPGGKSDSFDVLEALADERPVIVYDQLGCGLSDIPSSPEPYRIERFVEELAQVRQALDLKRVHLYGHSWGTMLAVDYLLTKPDGIVSVTLAGPLLSTSRWVADQRAYLAAMPGGVLQTVEKYEAEGKFDDPEYRRIETDFYRLHLNRGAPTAHQISRGNFGGAAYNYMWGPSEFSATGTLKTYERVERAGEITAPTLFICGEFDEASPASGALYQSKIPGAQLEVVAGASHMAYQEQPDVYRAILRKFLHSTESRP